ncbi:tyrosine-type recombinase/integrase [Vibrio halioticoli]|nr:tyrosine-type recombinase/integrase [Vibrio halioticoli]
MRRINPRVDANLIGGRNFDSIAPKKKRKTASMPPESVKDANRILDALYERSPILSLCCQMSALTGLRYSDSTWLRYDDFYDSYGNFKDSVAVVQQKPFNMRMGRKDSEFSAEKERNALRKSIVTLYTTNEIKKIVDETRLFSGGSDFLFANARSKTTDEFGGVITRPMHIVSADRHHSAVQDDLQLKFKLGTHSWRKFFALQLVRSGTTIEKIRDLLGQTSLVSTDKYLHSFTHELRAEVQKISLES